LGLALMRRRQTSEGHGTERTEKKAPPADSRRLTHAGRRRWCNACVVAFNIAGTPLRRRSISYTLVFLLGFVCSLLFAWLQSESLPAPVRQHAARATAAVAKAFDEVKFPEPVRDRARRASTAMSKAFDEMLTSDTMEGLLNTTSKFKEVLDAQATSLGITALLPNRTFGIRELMSTWQVPTMSQVLGRSERVGVRMRREGLSVHSPVVMVPGIITTGLEVWDGEECIQTYFRQRIWGTVSMFQSLLSDPDCWIRHLALNATTGLDPLQRPDFNRSIRVRPSQGFESADFFLGGYWLWGLMIEALADIGYDLNSMHMASYDWRLSFADLEHRDRYFTKLRQQIETLVALSGKKAVVIAHSMGGNVWHYFMQWVTKRVHRNWVNDHISSEILISAPLLGLPKAYFSLLTGDNRDFATMGTFSAVVNHVMGRTARRELWRTCSSLAMLMPMGGEKLWGTSINGLPLARLGDRNLTAEEAYNLLAKEGSVPDDLRRIAAWLLDGIRRSRPVDADATAFAQELPEHLWGNPLVAPLPFAPDLRMYAFYGVGVRTEVSGVLEEGVGDDEESVLEPRSDGTIAAQVQYSIDMEATEDRGFYMSDGDYSCPVVSLGSMCLKGWHDPRRNAARIPCTIKEYADKPTTLVRGRTIRGGAESGDHIDILGNDELLIDVLNVVSGKHVDGRIVSDIEAIVEKWDDA